MKSNNLTPFTQNEVVVFYSLVYYVESEVLPNNSIGFNCLDNNFKLFCGKNKIQIYPDISNVGLYEENKNVIIFTNSKRNQIGSILVHLRNSICHAKIRKVGKFYIFEDFWNNAVSMKACIDSSIFLNLIEEMKSTKLISK